MHPAKKIKMKSEESAYVSAGAHTGAYVPTLADSKPTTPQATQEYEKQVLNPRRTNKKKRIASKKKKIKTRCKSKTTQENTTYAISYVDSPAGGGRRVVRHYNGNRPYSTGTTERKPPLYEEVMVIFHVDRIPFIHQPPDICGRGARFVFPEAHNHLRRPLPFSTPNPRSRSE